ncbi:MAG: stage II sporulation protein M [Candidatus Omnitrophica bacterium]|nr:stage II sporulation protein M [Candidatus Omnitrophota bacterium]
MTIADKYRVILEELRSRKNYIYFSVGLFLFSVIYGVVTPDFDHYAKGMMKSISAIVVMDKRLLSVIVSILWKNIFACFMALFLGVFFALIPIFSLLINGIMFGVYLPDLSKSFFITIIPHGIFELPAYFISMSYGIWLGLWPWQSNRLHNIVFRAKKSVLIFINIVFPLLVIAAIIEGVYITWKA